MIFYGPKEDPGVKELGQKSRGSSTRVGGTPTPGHVGLPRGRLGHLLDVRPTPKIPINTDTPENKPRSRVPPLQAPVATKNQSAPRSGTLPEGESITGGHLHHPGGIHDKEGVVHLWG